MIEEDDHQHGSGAGSRKSNIEADELYLTPFPTAPTATLSFPLILYSYYCKNSV